MLDSWLSFDPGSPYSSSVPMLQTQGGFGPSVFGASLSPHGDLSRCQAPEMGKRRFGKVCQISGWNPLHGDGGWGWVTKDDSHHPQLRMLDWQGKVLVLWMEKGLLPCRICKRDVF